MKMGNGFTLIEVLVTSLISTIVAGALLSFLYMTNNQIKEGTTNLKFVQMQSTVSDQIRQVGDSAHGVLTENDPVDGTSGAIISFDPAVFPQVAIGAPNAKALRLCKQNGTTYAHFRINTSSNYLEEWYKWDQVWRVFKTGQDTAFIDGSKSFFNVYPGRRGFEFTLVYQSKDGKISSPLSTEKIRCRN